jgi:hypothetical protein
MWARFGARVGRHLRAGWLGDESVLRALLLLLQLIERTRRSALLLYKVEREKFGGYRSNAE